MRFRKKPVVIEATQWFKNGDHPADACVPIQPAEGDQEVFMSEGKVVRYFRNPEVPGTRVCEQCIKPMHVHGWIDTLEGGHVVCVGDWIITGVKGEKYPCKPDIFEATYEAVEKLNVKSHRPGNTVGTTRSMSLSSRMMPLEQQVPKLEYCQRLKELGFPQESYFTWFLIQGRQNVEGYAGKRWILDEEMCRQNYNDVQDECSAPTVAEMGEMLPKTIHFNGACHWVCGPYEKEKWTILYTNADGAGFGEVFGDAEAYARAKMLIYLIEKGLVKL